MHKITTIFIIFIYDLLALFLAFIFSLIIYRYMSSNIVENQYNDLISFESLLNARIFLLTSLVTLFVFYNRGHYLRRIPWWSQVRYIIITLTITLFIEVFLSFITKSNSSILSVTLPWLLFFIFLIIGRQTAKLVANKLGLWKIDTIIIGDSENIIETIFALSSEKYTGYDVKTLIINKGYNNFNKDALPIGYRNIKIIDASNKYENLINKNKESFYIIAPNSFDSFSIENLIRIIKNNSSVYAVIPPLQGIKLYGTSPQYFFGHDIVFLFPRNKIGSPFGKIAKRSTDIVLSFIALIATLPVWIVILLVIRTDGGPAFFGHKRVGKNNKPFKCLKFRSMEIDAEERLNRLLDSDIELKKEWLSKQKLDNDPRITRIGNILRKTSLDEIPQLINVLKGDMSLVGPRPIVESEKKHYGDKLSEYLSVRPGITGLWQVSGRSDTSYQYRVYLDSWYVNNWSMWSDLVVIFKTPVALLKSTGAY